jgi:hypothetical protein
MFRSVRVLLVEVSSPIPESVQRQRGSILSNTDAHLVSAAIAVGVFPREELHGMERLVDVANKVEKPCESNTSFCGITPGS